MVSLLSITSRHKLDTHASRLILRRGSVVHRKLRLDEPGFDTGRSGTIVEVHNLFGDLPVRSRYMYEKFSSTVEIERCFEVLRRVLTGYLLACSGLVDLSCTVKGTTRRLVHQRPVDMDFARQLSPEMVTSVLSQTRPGSALNTTNWRIASVRTSKYVISAAISVDPAPSPFTQYMSIGKTPIHAREDHGMLFRAINDRFQMSRFGQTFGSSTTTIPRGTSLDSGHSHAQNRVDRWPMFYIRVNTLADDEARQELQQNAPFAITDINSSLTRALESLISHFLVAEDLESAPKKANLERRARSRQRHDRRTSTATSASTTPKFVSAKPSSQLSQWHRVKSGRSTPKDIDYGLPFAKTTDFQYAQIELNKSVQFLFEELSSDDTNIESSSCENGSIASSDGPNILEHSSHDAGQKESFKENIIWINARSEQTILVNPRTGSTVTDNEQVHSPQNTASTSRHPTPTLIACLHASDCSNITGSHLSRSPHLEPYRKTPLDQQEAPILSVPPSELIGLEEMAPACPVKWTHRVTKEGLSRAKILGQVDQKFILLTIEGLIILIDQHAADERVKLEQLCRELCNGDPTILAQPLVFEIEEDEAPLFRSWQAYFRLWHIIYALEEDQTNDFGHGKNMRHRGLCISVTALPRLIAERCRVEPALLIDLVRQELWSDRCHSKLETSSQPPLPDSWHAIASSCPKGILELLKSRSCRTAIMFNDILDRQECERLVRRLSKCDLPFQCAHGRPTLTVLTEIGSLDNDPGSSALGVEALMHDSTVGFGAAWGRWGSKF